MPAFSKTLEEEGEATIEWVAEEAPAAEGEMYIILENGEGGTALWTSPATIVE